MQKPPVRYVHTDDGVSLAYTVFGEGPPLMYAFSGPGLSHFESVSYSANWSMIATTARVD